MAAMYFLMVCQSYLKGHNLTEEIPKVPRYAGRPRLHELFPDPTREDKAQRNAGIVKAHLEFGYTLKQIAMQIGLHYSTVSKIVSANSG